MIITFLEPFNSKLILKLSTQDKDDYFRLLDVCSKKLSIPKKFKYNGDIKLDNFVLSGLITRKDEEENYIEFDDHYMTSSDYEKLLIKYTKVQIDEMIIRFQGWKSPVKKTRLNIAGTIRNWLSKEIKTSTILTGKELEFANKSWIAYIDSTLAENDGSFKIKYYKILETYFKTYSIDELRVYLEVLITKQASVTDKKFVKTLHKAVEEFMDILKYKKVKR